MSGLDDLERQLKREVDKEVNKWNKKNKFDQYREMNRARMGGIPSISSIVGGLKIAAYGTVKGVRKIRDALN